MGICLQGGFFGIANPSSDGSITHTLRKQIRDAGVAEAVDLDARQARLLRMLDSDSAYLAVAHRGEDAFAVSRLYQIGSG